MRNIDHERLGAIVAKHRWDYRTNCGIITLIAKPENSFFKEIKKEIEIKPGHSRCKTMEELDNKQIEKIFFDELDLIRRQEAL